MPKRPPRLAEEGRIRSDEEYIDWAQRVSGQIEDIRESLYEDRWREHVQEHYTFSFDEVARERQLKGLWERGMRRVWEELPEAGILPSTRYTPRGHYFQYRDIATGRFISAVEAAARFVPPFTLR